MRSLVGVHEGSGSRCYSLSCTLWLTRRRACLDDGGLHVCCCGSLFRGGHEEFLFLKCWFFVALGKGNGEGVSCVPGLIIARIFRFSRNF